MIKYLRVKYKCILKKYKLINQFCKCCGKDMNYDYSVPDDVWEQVPKKYHNHVLCLNCFCKLYPHIDKFKIEIFPGRDYNE